MKTEILKYLKETNTFVSGQDLCNHFHVSRTAVWKVINQLKEEGYEIEAVRNKGYRLVEVADVITKAELLSSMTTRWTGKTIEYYDEITSTNNRAKELGEKGAPEGMLVVADYQSAGKGRRGRTWISPRGSGIWMSLLLRPDIPPASASMLTLVAALAVAQGIEQVTGLDTKIKWPNDIVVNGKKVCGILTEMSAEMDHVHYVVVGPGINVNTTEFPDEIREIATSLLIETGHNIKRSDIIVSIMSCFERNYDLFMQNTNLKLLKEEYHNRLANKEQKVKVLLPDGDYTGVSLGINDLGELIVKTDQGEIRHVVSGEVSVRGIYGYI